MLKLVALLHLARVLVPSSLTTWPALDLKPDSLTVPTMAWEFITAYILKMLESFAGLIVSFCNVPYSIHLHNNILHSSM
jgi:hypothetical protein